jgi:hypothetical protein
VRATEASLDDAVTRVGGPWPTPGSPDTANLGRDTSNVISALPYYEQRIFKDADQVLLQNRDETEVAIKFTVDLLVMLVLRGAPRS